MLQKIACNNLFTCSCEFDDSLPNLDNPDLQEERNWLKLPDEEHFLPVPYQIVRTRSSKESPYIRHSGPACKMRSRISQEKRKPLNASMIIKKRNNQPFQALNQALHASKSTLGGRHTRLKLWLFDQARANGWSNFSRAHFAAGTFCLPDRDFPAFPRRND
jgi:hypothetical protein